MTPSVKELSEFLGRFRYKDSMIKEGDDWYLPFARGKFPWNGGTCRKVVCYIIKFCSNDAILSTKIRHLEMLSSKFYQSYRLGNNRDSDMCMMREISEMFVDSFMPYVQKFFKLPRLEEINHDDNAILPKENELLAVFLDFLLQILNSEATINSCEEERYAILHKKLTFLLSILGDLPFQCTELEEVKIILGEIETLANEVGRFIYSCVFVTHYVKPNQFIEGKNAILEMVKLLKVKIKDHCINFPKLLTRLCVTTPKADDAIDSLFIVDSLLEDLENSMNSQTGGLKMKLPFKTLHEELMFTRSLLNGDTRMDELKDSLVQIRDVAYEVEYLVNSYIAGSIPFWYMNIRLPTTFEKIKLIRTNLQENITKDYAGGDISFQDMGTPKVTVDNILVGFEVERRKIISDLTGGSRYRQIVSISGMAGLGKTTIAKNLYDDRLIIENFDRRAWCVVSQTYQKKRVLSDILTCLSSNSNNLHKDVETLALDIYQILKGRKYLIVMDDVWSSNLWDELDRFFPEECNGSRIMFTSRIKDAVPTYSISVSLPLLTGDQSWRILENNVFSRKSQHCPPQLVDIGKRIATKCGGLPLVVLVTGGVLANLDKEESVWAEVETNLDSYIFHADENYVSKILEHSFKHLPDHLKLCFLYFGTFPEDAEIPVQKLMWLWIAEGFIQREQEKSPEQVAEKYLWELIGRSLVIIARRKYHDGGIKTCNIHDLLRDMCLRIAGEKNFSKSMGNYSSIYEKYQRLYFPSKFTYGMGSFGLHCRSISSHAGEPSSCSSSSSSHSKLVRVIDMCPVMVDHFELKRNNYVLVQLRYLAYDIIPRDIGRFINLEFLCIRTHEEVSIPSVLLKLVRLRHLQIKEEAEFGGDCGSCQTTNLRSLSRILIRGGKDEEILRGSTHLRKLSCELVNYYDKRFPDFCFFNELESLNVKCTNCYQIRLAEFTAFPSTIRKLSLAGISLPWEKTSIIGRLPNLQVLILGHDAFYGSVWETRDGEFEELRFLKLNMQYVGKWITCSEHFPQLECLVVDCCNIKEIPRELGDINTLRTIKMVECLHYEANLSAVEIEIEQRENGNEDLNVFITNLEWSKEQLVQECKQRASQEVDE